MKDIVVLVLYRLIYNLVKLVPATAKPKNLLIIKTDEIGDYILARNVLPYFKSPAAFKEHQVTFIGNSIFKQLYEKYDASIADNVIWLNKKKFRTNFSYRFRMLKQLRQAGYSDVVNLVYSRSFRVDDVMAAVTTASEKVTMSQKPVYWSKVEKVLTPPNSYTRVIDQNNEMLFDAIRNATFVEQIIQKPVAIDIKISPTENIDKFSLPGSYFIIFPGSGLKTKKWPPQHFSAVAKHIKLRYNLEPVVCGGPADRSDNQEFIQQYDSDIIDLTGKTTLPEFLAVLKKATCLISVDTGAVHLAAAVGCPIFALFSGLHYGRFSPYPTDLAPHFYPVYPDTVDEFINDRSFTALQNIPPDLLRTIQPDKLIKTIDQQLPKIINIESVENTGLNF